MHILINGWFLNQLASGSGQYLHQLMAQLAQGARGPDASNTSVRFTVFYPATAQNASQEDLWPGVMMQCVRVPPLPPHLRKLWWEQITMPRAAQRLQADLLWIPYWAAPLWQPCPTVATVHDIIHYLLPAYRGGRLQRLYTSLVS